MKPVKRGLSAGGPAASKMKSKAKRQKNANESQTDNGSLTWADCDDDESDDESCSQQQQGDIKCLHKRIGELAND